MGSPVSEIDPSASSSPPIESQTLTSRPVSGSTLENIDPYLDAQDTEWANTPGLESRPAATKVQQSVMYSNTYIPTSPSVFPSTPTPLTTTVAPDYHSAPITTPTASHIVVADDQTINPVIFSEMSTEVIVDDTATQEAAIAEVDEYDDGYDTYLV